jgi:hypothetical protein
VKIYNLLFFSTFDNYERMDIGTSGEFNNLLDLTIENGVSCSKSHNIYQDHGIFLILFSVKYFDAIFIMNSWIYEIIGVPERDSAIGPICAWSSFVSRPMLAYFSLCSNFSFLFLSNKHYLSETLQVCETMQLKCCKIGHNIFWYQINIKSYFWLNLFLHI